MLNYRIEEKPEMILTGYKQRFHGVPYGQERLDQEHDFFVSTRAKQWLLYGATWENRYVHYQIITNIDVENANEYGWTGTGKVKKILLSNDPDFGAYEEMSLLARINDKNPDRCEYVDYMSKWLYSGNVPYRYVRIYATPAAAGYTNWGDDQTPCFAIKEMYVYAEENSAVENIKSEATMTVDGYDAFWPVANAVDGNLDTSAGIYNYQGHQYIQANFDKEQAINTLIP